MDIYTYAMNMEKESEAYYRELGQNCGDSDLEGVFELLAEQEVRHYNVLQNMREQTPAKMVESDLVGNAREIFVRIRNRGEVSCGLDQVELYEKAQEIEAKTRDHYLANAEEARDEKEKALFLRIADEERKHYALLENIITLVSQPDIWLEDAEWYHLDEY